MKAIRPVIRELSIAYYRWALAEIDPLHEDVPFIVHRLRDLLVERNARRCYLRRGLEWL